MLAVLALLILLPGSNGSFAQDGLDSPLVSWNLQAFEQALDDVRSPAPEDDAPKYTTRRACATKLAELVERAAQSCATLGVRLSNAKTPSDANLLKERLLRIEDHFGESARQLETFEAELDSMGKSPTKLAAALEFCRRTVEALTPGEISNEYLVRMGDPLLDVLLERFWSREKIFVIVFGSLQWIGTIGADGNELVALFNRLSDEFGVRYRRRRFIASYPTYRVVVRAPAQVARRRFAVNSLERRAIDAAIRLRTLRTSDFLVRFVYSVRPWLSPELEREQVLTGKLVCIRAGREVSISLKPPD